MRRPDDVRPRRPAGRGLRPAGAVSLARALSKFGVASRREAERWIADGRVRVNGLVERTPSRWIDPARDRVDGGRPPGRRRHASGSSSPSTSRRASSRPASDPGGRPTVYDALGDVGRWVFPVGRLDRDTSGLLILTNDHRLGERLTDPEHHVPKTYHARVRGVPDGRGAAGPARGPAARRRDAHAAGEGARPRHPARAAAPSARRARARPGSRSSSPRGRTARSGGWARRSGTRSSSSCACASGGSPSASWRRASGASSGRRRCGGSSPTLVIQDAAVGERPASGRGRRRPAHCAYHSQPVLRGCQHGGLRCSAALALLAGRPAARRSRRRRSAPRPSGSRPRWWPCAATCTPTPS